MKILLMIPLFLFSALFSKYLFAEKVTEFHISLQVHTNPCSVMVSDVDFGTLSPDNVNNLQYRRKLEITPNCPSGAKKLSLTFDGGITAAGQGMLAAYDAQHNLRDDFGIRIEDANGNQINVFDAQEYTGAVLPDIYVRPYTREITPLKTGSFNAQATISIWYE